MKRRDFIKIGMSGLAYISAGSAMGIGAGATTASAQVARPSGLAYGINLTMEEVMLEMVDKIPVYHWAYTDGVNGFRIPGPVIVVAEGDTVSVNITNNVSGGSHAFAIPGIVNSGVIPHGGTVNVTFAAPPAGTYMYLDPLNAPMNRVMGLCGMLISLPRVGNAPYSAPTPAVQKLFNDLGTFGWSFGRGSSQFPGHPWDPDRTYLWLFQTVDSTKNSQVQADPGMTGEEFRDGYHPDYFLISGKGGFFLSHDTSIGPTGHVGQPALIRACNAGLNNASPHIHGNHVYLLSENNALEQTNLPLPLPANGNIHENVALIDTWIMRPGDRKDLLLPFMMPPDIPIDRNIDFDNAVIPLSERFARGGSEKMWPPIEEPFPLIYPMHDHDEIAQTAAHGNYPQGAVLHWMITNRTDGQTVHEEFGSNRKQSTTIVPGKDGVILVDRADVLVRARRVLLILEGRYSGLRGDTLTIFAGNDFNGAQLGQATVESDGSWTLRIVRRLSPAIRNLATVSIRNENTGAFRLAVRFQMI